MRPDRLDELDQALRRDRPGRRPLTDDQRRIIIRAAERAAPFTAAQRLILVRLLRTSPHWQALKTAAAQ